MSSNFALTFSHFINYCLIESISSNCSVVALTMMLMLLEHKKKSLYFDMLELLQQSSSFKKEFYQSLYAHIDSSIILNCSSNVINSLLCSNFFKIDVFCNLLKAHSLNAVNILNFLKKNFSMFNSVMIKRFSNFYFI